MKYFYVWDDKTMSFKLILTPKYIKTNGQISKNTRNVRM
jgi:hypothetical protein